MEVTIYGRSEELVSRCVECNLAEQESLASLGGSAPELVYGILSTWCSVFEDVIILEWDQRKNKCTHTGQMQY